MLAGLLQVPALGSPQLAAGSASPQRGAGWRKTSLAMLSLSMLLIASKMSYACGGEQVPAPSPLGLPQWAEEGCSGRLVSCPAPGLLQGAPEGSWVHACSSGAWPPLVLGPSPPVSVAPCSSATEDVWAAGPSVSTGPTTGEGLPQVGAWHCWCGASAPCSRTRPGERCCHLMWSMRLPRAVPHTPCRAPHPVFPARRQAAIWALGMEGNAECPGIVRVPTCTVRMQ